MTDLEMKKLCAEAVNLNWDDELKRRERLDGAWRTHQETEYDPFHDDAQAMALVKRFGMTIVKTDDLWGVDCLHSYWNSPSDVSCSDPDLNRAIVECVAKMQAQKVPRGT